MANGRAFSLGTALIWVAAVTSWPQLTNAAAGATPGTFGVSPSGAATYSVPIWAPPGPQGMQPAMSLVYSSNGGSSLLGVGWQLGGLSEMRLCSRTVAQDGAISTSNDRGGKLCE